MFASVIREGERVMSTRTRRQYVVVGWADQQRKVRVVDDEGEAYEIDPKYLRHVDSTFAGNLLVNLGDGVKTL